MDSGFCRQFEAVGHWSYLSFHLKRAIEPGSKFKAFPDGNSLLSVGLQFEKYPVTYFKRSLCAILVSKELHPLLSLSQVVSNAAGNSDPLLKKLGCCRNYCA